MTTFNKSRLQVDFVHYPDNERNKAKSVIVSQKLEVLNRSRFPIGEVTVMQGGELEVHIYGSRRRYFVDSLHIFGACKTIDDMIQIEKAAKNEADNQEGNNIDNGEFQFD